MARLERGYVTSVSEPARIKRLERSGLALAYCYNVGTQTERTPLVFVHGWAGSRQDWQKIVSRYIEQGQSVLVYDAAGFGQSQFATTQAAHNADYGLDRYVEDLRALLEAEQLKRVRLVGHSWGGVVAMCFAARYPAQVESLVAIGSAYFDPHKLLHQFLKWASYVIAQLIVLSKPLLQRAVWLRRLAVRRYFYRPPTEAEVELLMNDVLHSHKRTIVQTLLTSYAVQFKEICPAITCPTLYLGSDHDVVAPLAYVTAFVPFTPHATSAVISNCGHFPMLEQPNQLVQALNNFFAII